VFNFEPKSEPPLPIKKADEIAADLMKLDVLVKHNQGSAESDKGELQRQIAELKEQLKALQTKTDEVKFINVPSGAPCPTGFTYRLTWYMPVIEEKYSGGGPFAKCGVIPGGSWAQNVAVCQRNSP